MYKFLFVIVVWFSIIPAQAAMTPWPDCLDRVINNQSSDINLHRDCPDLYLYLQDENIFSSTYAFLSQPLTYPQVEFLQRNLMPLSGKRWHPDFNDLQQILDQILVKTNRDNEWEIWDAFINWLKQLRLEQYAESLTDFADFIQALMPSKETMKIILASLIVMIFMIILYFVAVELRLAGLFNWSRKNTMVNQTDSTWLIPDSAPLGWQELLQLPVQKQPAAMLKFVINFLIVNDILEYQSACTNQELLNRLNKASASQAINFKHILVDIEPVIYGNCKIDDVTLQRIRHTASLITGTGKIVEG